MSKSYKRFPKLKQEKEDYHYLNRQLRRDKLAELPKGAHTEGIDLTGTHGLTDGRGKMLKIVIIKENICKKIIL